MQSVFVPAGADDMVRTVIARVVRRRAGAEGLLRIGPFAPGEYEVCRGDEPAGDTVRVAGPETRVSLRATR